MVVGILGRHHCVGPLEEALVVLSRKSEELRDGQQRQTMRHIAHEIAGSLSGRGPHDVVGGPRQAVLERLQGAGRESTRDQLAQPRVRGGIGVVHHHLGELELLGADRVVVAHHAPLVLR